MGNQSRQGRLKDIANIKSSPNIGALMRKALQAPKLRNPTEGIPSSSYVSASAGDPDEYNTSLEFRGNPVYSPEEISLAKAASKLENLHQKSISLAKNKSTAGGATTPEAGSYKQPRTAADQIPAHKPQPSDAATPGWRPPADSTGTADDLDLAARTFLAKRNRRKSVFQRPTRYGDWFDGDDDELEQMVDDFNGDEEAAREAHRQLQAQRKQQTKMEGRAALSRRKNALPTTSEKAGEEEEQDAGMEDKKTTPLSSAGLPLVSSTDMGTDIANKVRAIADGLCERLDGLIEESPALPRGAKRDDKSLRDKLLESWEGRSYYERLMQMAGGSAEQDDLKAELEAAKTENNKDSSPSDKESLAVEKQPAAPQHALSFLSPPKPKLRLDVAAALQAAANRKPLLPPAKDLPTAAPKVAVAVPATVPRTQPGKVSPTTINAVTSQVPSKLQLQLPQQQPQHHTQEISRGLLKVSARGSKPMPAPWQQGNEDDAPGIAAPVASPSPSVTIAAEITEEEENEEKVQEAIEEEKEENIEKENTLGELETLRRALAEMTVAKQAAEKEAEHVKKVLSDMEIKLEEAEEDLKTESTIRAAAEKRIQSLETEIATLQTSSADAGGCQNNVLGKIVDDATQVQNNYSLVESQVEALLTAANALSQQISSGRVLAESMVENVTAAQAAAVQAGEEGKTRVTRARRKSAWRG